MRKNKITMMIPRLFPTRHSRRGERTHFIEQIMNGDKIHMIRGQYDRWRVIADKTHERPYSIALCQWNETPRRSKFHQVGAIDTEIGVQHITMWYFAKSDTINVTVDGNDVPVERIAANEGLTLPDFKEWFFGRNRTENDEFVGCIVHFGDFRY